MKVVSILIVLVFHLRYLKTCSDDCYFQAKRTHRLRGISDKDIDIIGNLLNFRSILNEVFNNINLIRPVGSTNHEIVEKYIKTHLRNLKWEVEEDRFLADTVIGTKEFVNIIGIENPKKSRRLILACHYDSLNKDEFYASTDSALPCSLLLSIAEILTPFLQKNQNIDISLELVFFDGEEAFLQWSANDSLYGSNHLSTLWSDSMDDCQCSRLHKIDSLILLDLLGANNPKFYNSHNGNKYFDSMLTIEKRIRQRSIFKDRSGHPYFQSYALNSMIEDDHVPFMRKNVPYVHLITVPFPPVWHTIDDNARNINWEVSKDLELILTVFLVEYFHLSIQEPNAIYKSLHSTN